MQIKKNCALLVIDIQQEDFVGMSDDETFLYLSMKF